MIRECNDHIHNRERGKKSGREKEREKKFIDFICIHISNERSLQSHLHFNV